MQRILERFFSRYPIKTRRALEMLPGIISWSLITFPVWGSFFMPYQLAYFILFFDIYWFYKSFSLAITSYIASRKINKAEKIDWNKKAKELENYQNVSHIAIIPNYTERVDKLRITIKSLAEQSFSAKKIFVVLAMEQREKDGKKKADELINEFKNVFGGILATFHPDIAGEVKGKSSNEAYAAKAAYKKLVGGRMIKEELSTISSVDADSIFDKQYFAYLTYKFLSDDKKYNKFWQSATIYYSNIWKVPAPTRIVSFFGSLWNTAVLIHKNRLITNATYSTSLRLMKEIDFWDTDVIPEDYRICFKAFYKKHGNVWIDPIFLRTSMDAAHSAGYVKSLRNKYEQERRWAWGASDDYLFIKWWLTVPGVPFIRKTLMLFPVVRDHFLWPTNWFIVTIAANVMPLINPVFSRTTIGYNLPRLAGFILTSSMLSLLAMIIVDAGNRPKNLPGPSKKKQAIFPLEFILLPFVGFFLSSLPALVSHTQLLLGKRLEYKVTEKI
jgi:hypothetical protein